MERMARIEREVRLLDRVVAILLALAGLADRAAAAPWPVRYIVLWMLRRADGAAADFAARFAAARGLRPRPVLAALDGDDPAAALALALSLRMLALSIGGLSVQLRRRQRLFGRRPVIADGPAGLRAASLAGTAAWPVCCPDTS